MKYKLAFAMHGRLSELHIASKDIRLQTNCFRYEQKNTGIQKNIHRDLVELFRIGPKWDSQGMITTITGTG